MDFRQLFLAQHARAHASGVGNPDFSLQELVLRDLKEQQLRQRPLPGVNSLAWNLWHMTRAEDVGINLVIAQRPQVLDENGWAARLNVTLRDVATGMTDQEVEIFSQHVNIPSLLDYRAAVGRQTQDIVRELQPETLDEQIDSRLVESIREAGIFGPQAEWIPRGWLGKQKGFTLMHTVLGHTFLHLGQCDDIRGLLGHRSR